MWEYEVLFINNLAECDICLLKMKLKVSGCFCILQGVWYYVRIKSFCSMVKKYGLFVYEELFNVWWGELFFCSYVVVGNFI